MDNTFKLTPWGVEMTVVLKTAREMSDFKLPSDTYVGGSNTEMDDFLLDLSDPTIEIRQFEGDKWVIIYLEIVLTGMNSWDKDKLALVYNKLHKPFKISYDAWDEKVMRLKLNEED